MKGISKCKSAKRTWRWRKVILNILSATARHFFIERLKKLFAEMTRLVWKAFSATWKFHSWTRNGVSHLWVEWPLWIRFLGASKQITVHRLRSLKNIYISHRLSCFLLTQGFFCWLNYKLTLSNWLLDWWIIRKVVEKWKQLHSYTLLLSLRPPPPLSITFQTKERIFPEIMNSLSLPTLLRPLCADLVSFSKSTSRAQTRRTHAIPEKYEVRSYFNKTKF